MGFISEHIYFDIWRALFFILFIILNSFILLFLQFFYEHHTRVLYYISNFGYWKKIKKDQIPSEHQILEWNIKNSPYSKGSIVLFQNGYYLATSEKNIMQPGLMIDQLLYLIFKEPERTLNWCLVFQIFIVSFQITSILVQFSDWEGYFPLIMFNYYLLYLILWIKRDYAKQSKIN